MTGTPASCPDPLDLAAYLSAGRQDGGVEAHLASCEECRHVVIGAAASGEVGAARPARGVSGRAWRAAAAALLAAGVAVYATGRLRADDIDSRGGRIVSALGETLRLGDGTELALASGTHVADVARRPGERRRIRLERGALAAQVPHGGGGFVVETAAMDVRVLGTAFSVRTAVLSSGEAVASVEVSEGVVRVEAQGRAEDLRAGWSAHAVAGMGVLVQQGRPVSGPGDLCALLDERRAAVAAGDATRARWLEAILLASGGLSAADLGPENVAR
ncbi:MAG: FecR domain-containing protein [Planctomycetes bacterium]|nr:FecR domain-containing protein [Planctomycetota bacterium]